MCYLSLGLSISIAFVSIVALFFMGMNTHTDIMAKNGLVFISSAAKVQNVCYKVSKYVQKMLYIKINGNTERTIPTVSKQIVNLYTNAATQCGNIDIRLLLKYDATSDFKSTQPIDLILYDSDLQKETSRLKQLVLNKPSSCKEQNIDIPASQDCANVEPVKTYEYVALGGTFDRLHNGHKILLSEAVLRSTKHVTVGVTDVNMIQSKKLWELIEPVEKRINAVLDFLMDINPDLEYHVVPLHDLYGPTKDDPKFQLIVVSEETVGGAKKINEKRAEGGLAPLDTHVIGLAADSAPQRTKEEEEKLSSSNQRMRLLGTLLRPPKPNPDIPDWPYVIGISGGIASGKSSIADKLRAKGAVVIDCDKVAHELYRPGLPLNRTVADAFGANIIDARGEVDRRALGDIVFRDQEQLQKLNSLVWPAVWAETERLVAGAGAGAGAGGARVAGVEAAVMLAAGWQRRVHQLWAVIVPPAEAIKRLQKRNNLTEEEARRRVDAQPSNAEQVAAANIVFSPYWSYEYTQSQVDRAWDLLQEYLKTRPDLK